jgi:type I restriction enzyme M protein
MSAEEYMHVILGILSLKYISDKYDSALHKIKELGFSIEEIEIDEFYAKFDAFKVPETSH